MSLLPIDHRQRLSARRVGAAVALLDAEFASHKAVGVYAMFSGGDDSLTSTLVASQSAGFRACVHLDTGIGIPETRDFVAETCREQGWELLVFRAKDCGQDYAALAERYGFPGPGAHRRMYIRLKERPLDAFVRSVKRHRLDRVILSTGARTQESARRMGHVQPVRRDGASVWANPIHDWSKADCLDYIAQRGVRRNPVVELIHMSGECLCGSYAAPGELKEIALWFPHVGAHIRAIEDRAVAAGVKSCRWGEAPKGRRRKRGKISELCQQCELRFA